MNVLTDADLYQRGVETLLASWHHYAQQATGAALMRAPGVAVAIFPNEPERSIYNNTVFDRHLTLPERIAAVEAMEAAYRRAGITCFAAWTHDSDVELAPSPSGRQRRWILPRAATDSTWVSRPGRCRSWLAANSGGSAASPARRGFGPSKRSK